MMAFLQTPDVRARVRSNPGWSAQQKARLLALVDEWEECTQRYRRCEYRRKISRLGDLHGSSAVE